MPEQTTIKISPADLTVCDREPIHIPGSIQPHGVLLVISEPEYRIIQASRNAGSLLLGEDRSVVGESLYTVLDRLSYDLLQRGLNNPSLESSPFYLGSCPCAKGYFHAILHRSHGLLILELERSEWEYPLSFYELYPLTRNFLGKLQSHITPEELCQLAAVEVRSVTGFDRVLIYKFDADWNGRVIAEDRNDLLPSYIDLRFPASDIPRQARELYRLNRLRLIASSEGASEPILPVLNPQTGAPLDLSFSTLRSVSPVHLEYMRNMGTATSMSISLLRKGELWGLISCHHHVPRHCPFDTRTLCDLLGQALSLQLEAAEHIVATEKRNLLRSVEKRLLGYIAEETNFAEVMDHYAEDWLGLVSAQGAAVVMGEECSLIGTTPEQSEVLEIAAWLVQRPAGEVFCIDSLVELWPQAEAFAFSASGLLAISLSKVHRNYLLWFRPEVIQTVKWGGDPNKPVEETHTERIHPRKSFEMWKESVHLHSIPWLSTTVESAIDFRAALVEIVLRKAEELAALSAELTRSNKELEAFSYSVSHDLRAPFRHIAAYSELLRDTDGEKISEIGGRFLSNVIDSAAYAGNLVDSLLNFAQIGRSALKLGALNMNLLVAEVIQDLEQDAKGRNIDWKIGTLPEVQADLVMIRMVMENLISNALKYTRKQAHTVIEVRCEQLLNEYIFSIRDNGAGFDMRYVDKLFGVFQRLHRADEFEGTGIGLANVRRLITRHKGRTWAEGELNQGATFYFSLPIK